MIYISLLLLFLFHESYEKDDSCPSMDILEVEGLPTIPTWYSETEIFDATSECQNPCRSLDDFHDSYNLIEIKKHLLWLRRTKEKYIFCCKKPVNCSKIEIMKEMFVFISEKQKKIPSVRFEKEPFKNFWILIVIGCVFSATVILHIIVSLGFICSVRKKKVEEASGEKFDNNSSALIEQNANLPDLFPLKIPNTSTYGTSLLAAKESEQLTEKTAICDEDTLIDWTASDAQKDYNQKAAELRKKLQLQKKISAAIATTPQREESVTALELENTQLNSESTQTSLVSKRTKTTNIEKTQSESIRKSDN